MGSLFEFHGPQRYRNILSWSETYGPIFKVELSTVNGLGFEGSGLTSSLHIRPSIACCLMAGSIGFAACSYL